MWRPIKKRSPRSEPCPATTAAPGRPTLAKVPAHGSAVSSRTSRCSSALSASRRMTGSRTSTGVVRADRPCSSAPSARPGAGPAHGRRRRPARAPGPTARSRMTSPRPCNAASIGELSPYPGHRGPIAQLARAPRLQRGGHRFEPCWDHSSPEVLPQVSGLRSSRRAAVVDHFLVLDRGWTVILVVCRPVSTGAGMCCRLP